VLGGLRPAPRLVTLLAVGLLFAVCALVSDLGAVGMVGWDLLVVLAFAADAAQLFRRGGIRVERRVRTHLLHGVRDDVCLVIRAERPGRATVIDEPPRDFVPRDVVEVPRDVRLVAQGAIEIRYPIRPRRRGRAVFGRVNILVDGPLGLARRRIVLEPDGVGEARVYPHVGDIDKGALDPKLMLAELGIKRTRKRAEGTEFESLRDAVIEDELKRIDWRATARRERLIAKNFELERNHEVLICLDTGRLMGALHAPAPATGDMDQSPEVDAPVPWTKLDHAIAVALRLAAVALRYGDRVGVLSFDREVGAWVRPDRGRAQLGRLLEAVHDLSSTSTDASYHRALMEIRRRQKKRSLVVFLTDFVDLETSAGAVDALSVLARRHVILFVALRDPHIREVSDAPIDDLAGAYRALAAMGLEESRAEVIEGLAARGIRALDLTPNAVTTGAIQAYLALRAAERF
jgi:uncharacterized protein (DUF58 family)